MALLACVIHYDDKSGKATASYSVLGVSVGDEILFMSDYPNTGIKYIGKSPFKGDHGPQADQVFAIGKEPGPFQVTMPSDGTRRHFDCGEAKAADAVTPQGTTTTTYTFSKTWAGGGDTPPDL